VYDKQSDQAQLTGFGRWHYEKTINLKLKKDKKKGVFGKVMQVAQPERYQGKFNINSFLKEQTIPRNWYGIIPMLKVFHSWIFSILQAKWPYATGGGDVEY